MSQLTVITGPMFAGKSTRLITEGERYAKAGFKVVYLKPTVDIRYSLTDIVTHDQMKVPAYNVGRYLKGLEVLKQADVVLIDEVQFLEPHLMEDVIELANEKIVIVAGLDTTYSKKPFENTAFLLAHADEIIKVKGICECGNDTRYSLLKSHIQATSPVLLGSNEMYQSYCRSCAKKKG